MRVLARWSWALVTLPLVLFRDDWALQHAEEKHPELKFLSAAPQLRELAATGS